MGNAPLKPIEKKSSQTAASKQKPKLKQDKRHMRKEAKGSQCAGKRGGDRATLNARWAKSMLPVGSPRLPCGRRAKSSYEETGQSIAGRKRRMSSVIERERT